MTPQERLEEAIRKALTQPHWVAQAKHYNLGPKWIAGSLDDLVTDIVDAIRPFVNEPKPEGIAAIL